MTDETRNPEQPENLSTDDRKHRHQTQSSGGASADPTQETRNEDANPAAGGRADRDPAEGARDEYGTRPGETQRRL